MKKIIDELINSSISGVDVYRYKDATWLIFTDEGRWVVELTDEGTLWYNYKFFNDVFKYVSMDFFFMEPKEYEGYITGWANDYFFNDVKEIYDSLSYRVQNRAENLVGKIIKEVKPNLVDVLFEEQKRCYHDPTCNANTMDVSLIVKNGIKNIYPDQISGDQGYNWSNEFESDKVIECGVKL